MQKTFDDIKKIDENGSEYWEARELQDVLEYAKWENFHKVIKQAQISCKINQQDVSDHFPDVGKTIVMPKGASKSVADYRLSRYACYLIVMNADPRKEIIAFGQNYFAVKTRQKEIEELYEKLSEDDKRLYLRGDIKQKNMLLMEAARKADIKTNFEYAVFQNFGYKGLYGGMTAQDIAVKKGLKPNQDILDHMGSAELGANLFRITQTEDVMKKKNVSTPELANDTHFKVGAAIRNTINELGGTMPEELPAPEKSIKELDKEKQNQLKENQDQNE